MIQWLARRRLQTPREAAATLGKLGATRRQQLEREPIRERARAMREAMNLPPAPALVPELVLTQADRIG
jgi:hypothetical protein